MEVNVKISQPTVNINDMDDFIDFIKTEKPDWCKLGKWQHGNILYDKFIELTDSNISKALFSREMRDRLYSSKRQMRLDGQNKIAWKIFNLGEIQ